MNYIQQILAFYDRQMINPLSSGQIALWHALMHVNNKCNWIEWFSVANQTLESLSGLSRQGVLKARNVLKQEGLIEFKSNGTKATNYRIKTLTTSNSVQVGIQDSIQVGIQNSIQSSVQSGVQSSSTLNKQNKTKLNENISNSNIYLSNARSNENRKPYGLYKNVLLSDVEFQSLVNEFRDWSERLERLSEYMATSGKTYNNHLATIRSWAKTDKVAQLPKVTLSDTEADLLMIKHTKV